MDPVRPLVQCVHESTWSECSWSWQLSWFCSSWCVCCDRYRGLSAQTAGVDPFFSVRCSLRFLGFGSVSTFRSLISAMQPCTFPVSNVMTLHCKCTFWDVCALRKYIKLLARFRTAPRASRSATVCAFYVQHIFIRILAFCVLDCDASRIIFEQ